MKIYLLSILSLLLYHHTCVQAGNSALCFLTYGLAPETLQFARQLAQDAVQYDVEIFIMIDDNNLTLSHINTSINLQLLQIPNQLCLQHNYHKTMYLGWGEITSWDKALLYFTLLNKNYSFVWLSEQDVFFPSTQAFLSLHELYSNTSDFIVPRVGLNLLGDPSIWLYSMAMGKLIPPWACSMVNVIGLSRRMLVAIDNYVQWLGEVPFHEFFFNTLAMQLNFTIVAPTELSTDVFSASYSIQDIHKQPNNLWHPFKSLDTQKQWRERLANERLINNTNIKLTNIEMLCHDNQNLTSMEQHLIDLVVRFEICKRKFSSNSRRLLRQRFSHLAEQCQKKNASKNTVSLAMKLADHAYKLPEPPVEVLVGEKSKYHLKLEEALEENKQSISQLPWNSSSLIELRKQTGELIKKLTFEIQREYKERQALENRTRLSPTATSIISTTIRIISSLFSSTRTVSLKVNEEFYKSQRENNNQMFDLFEDNMKILLLLASTFCILFVLLKSQKIQYRTCCKFVSVALFLLLLLFGILYNIGRI